MSVIIIGSGDGRAALRRFDAAQNTLARGESFFTADQANTINGKIAELCALADQFNCPPDPCPE